MADIQSLYEVYRAHPSVQTDTRKLQPGDIFFALKGEHFNGNQFARQALEAGAVLAVVDEPVGGPSDQIFTVPHVLETLQALARYHREQFQIPVLAITGSNGKTTTKELIHQVLSRRFKTYTTTGNLNNHIGIPLTLLKIRPDAQMAVVEMGANHQKEIYGYCKYVDPTHGLITNCGKAHLEGFGGVEGVRKGKGELYDYLRANRGTAFVMWDYDYLREMSRGIEKIIRYGTTGSGTPVTGEVLQSDPFLEVQVTLGTGIQRLKTQLVGEYNLPNVLAAVSVGSHFGVPDAEIRSAIQSYQPSNSRSQMIHRGTNEIILDAYNANPSSMQAAIENLAHLGAPQKVLILGAMAELGTDSLQEHQRTLDTIARYSWKDVILVGGDFLKLASPYRKFSRAEEVRGWLQQNPLDHCCILIKGSRSMQMEKVLEG